jgi:pimeloyl-ACP methyl ester carboxylesterase
VLVSSTDGVSLAVHDLGGDGPPLVVCHATGFCGRAYEPLARALSSIRHVWAIDFRGHGGSTRPQDDRFDWTGAAEDLLAVVDALGTGPLDLVGHSMGGAAITLAELQRPGTVRSAYLFEPIIFPGSFAQLSGGDNPMAAGARRRRPTFPSKAEALRNYAGKPPLSALNAGALAAYVEHGFEEGADGSATLRLSPDDEAAVFDAPGKPIVEQVASIDVPVTVAVGSTEVVFGPALFATAIAEALPQGRLSRFPTLGHFGPLESPSTVAADIAAHLHALPTLD